MEFLDKKSVPEELIVKIGKLSNLGYGIAKFNNYVIFVENACPEDVVKIKKRLKLVVIYGHMIK